MKKQALLFLTCTALFITGCSSTTPTTDSSGSSTSSSSSSTSSTSSSTSSSSAAPDASESANPSADSTAAPEETVLSTGKKASIGDWKVKVKKASVSKKIKNGSYRYFQPSKGNSFIVIDMSVRNEGKKAAQFLPRRGFEDSMVFAKLYYQDEYEYAPTELLSYDKDLTTKEIQPLKTKNGILVFDVPKKIAKAKKELTLKFTLADETIVYSLK